MRTHGRLLVSIWRDKDFVSCSVEAQRCYMMLLAQKDVNNAGVQPLMIRKWARGCEATSEDDIVRALNELQGARFVCYDVDSEELLIRSFIRNDGIVKQPNVLKNALRVAEQTESPRLRQALSDELQTLGRKDASEVASRMAVEGSGNPFENPSETLPEPLNPSGTPREPRGDGDGEGVTNNVVSPSDSKRVSAQKRGTRLPEGWMPDQSVIAQMRQERPDVDLQAEHRKFADHWKAATGKNATKRDWDATWRNWIRNARGSSRVAPISTTDARIAAAQALKDRPANVHPLRGLEA
ncbi:hypothetical protein EF294_03325 [Gordonia oryzae]|uniref:Uncharacterized protein n=1 Tax=Gordonia oryzae TaxID=2487349 RepID=A0A3N4H359_9ACTN|nr:hypothetical protein [Gordonia oryzae]RPA65781.1 hypothetical protein EF294_03325 [Gordonia oryzae]